MSNIVDYTQAIWIKFIPPSCYVNYEENEFEEIIDTTKIPIFNVKINMENVDIEKNEEQEAIKELIKLGIINPPKDQIPSKNKNEYQSSSLYETPEIRSIKQNFLFQKMKYQQKNTLFQEIQKYRSEKGK